MVGHRDLVENMKVNNQLDCSAHRALLLLLFSSSERRHEWHNVKLCKVYVEWSFKTRISKLTVHSGVKLYFKKSKL